MKTKLKYKNSKLQMNKHKNMAKYIFINKNILMSHKINYINHNMIKIKKCNKYC